MQSWPHGVPGHGASTSATLLYLVVGQFRLQAGLQEPQIPGRGASSGAITLSAWLNTSQTKLTVRLSQIPADLTKLGSDMIIAITVTVPPHY